jgi:hypothetical protein
MARTALAELHIKINTVFVMGNLTIFDHCKLIK